MSFLTIALAAVLLPEANDFGQPVRVVPFADRTLVASSDGTITSLDLENQKLGTPTPVSTSLSDLGVVSDSRQLLVIDQQAESLVVVSQELKPTGKLTIPGAERVAIDQQSGYCVVTSRWKKAVSICSVQPLKESHRIELPWEPLEVIAIGKGTFFVADAFRGEGAVIKSDGTRTLLKPLRGHNIRGLLLHKDELFVTHQRISEIARTDFSDLHWGMLMQNVLTRVPLENLRSGEFRGKTVPIGEAGSGSADPSTIVKLPDDRFAVALSGANEVVVSSTVDAGGKFWFDESPRYPTGTRPVHLAIAEDARTLVVANEFDHRLTTIRFPPLDAYPKDWDGRTFNRLVPETSSVEAQAKPLELTAEQRGRVAFFSGQQSHDGWVSCHSCHSDGHTIGFRADTLGDGNFGAAKLVPSLLGVSETAPWGWSGNFDSLSGQITKSVETTMHGTPDEQTANDLVAFLKSLEPHRAEQSTSASGQPVTNPEVLQGQKLFESKGCIQCHQKELYTSDRIVDVGLKDAVGQNKFNPPSLRSLRYRRVFFHDGSATTIESALKIHLSALKKEATKQEQSALRAFLLSL